ncbi:MULTISPECIES: acetolactate synthase small subunit [Mesonia]|uniref:Acetolactate synthase small subunit n=1 Tax=Mesonia oceanica TaxID=2687242 RepID=A0AC61YCL2_9FLAO|nr:MULTISPECIES: acetolactate synthase small subunit [Mesonia]MBJ96985.1 acetolactate synthase small subunit [Flavobacteriaceae bacterium]MAN25931.1 acetolactate synthase small subunit [Mesonia sp.]MAN26148.1 acetolactate synthase small subunit [Mesonia sp.]MAQ39516.1 acetolactate synthase small subunit [Mesonia sp.]VVV01598.1 Putative acetolactate synthase small subunit [Mesonia oceanica]|tara:strand:+ start:76 stop:615 length:540 start_codon:yes stop_codon:yes gene_type:complete
MKEEFTISVFTEDKIGLLNRVSIIFTRRHINIESITASASEVEGIHRYIIVVEEEESLVVKVIQQIEKQVDVVKAFYHRNEEMVHQEIALYKVPTSALASGEDVEEIIRSSNARILTVEAEFTIIEKTGHKADTQALYNKLEPYGLLGFVRSGRVAIPKQMKEFKEYMAEVEKASNFKY